MTSYRFSILATLTLLISIRCTEYGKAVNDKNITVYLNDIQKSVETLNEDKGLINEVLSKNTDGREILSVGFPEVIRWNEFQDIIEITVDKSVYVTYGATRADFSIGLFQMKPSFVESIENYLTEYPFLASKELPKNIVLKNKDEKSNRQIRIQRLSDTKWQLIYLSVYWLVANHRFKYIRFQNIDQKLKFYASAYNFGFTKPINQIENWQKKLLFPHGKNFKGTQVAYGDISIHFFHLYSPIFFTN